MKKTFYFIETEDGQKGIRCLKCKRTSFHPKDIENKYCGNCHIFYDKEYVPTRIDVTLSMISIWFKIFGFEIFSGLLLATLQAFVAYTIFVKLKCGAFGFMLVVFNIFTYGLTRSGDGERRANKEHLDHQKSMAKTLKRVAERAERGDDNE